MAELRAGNLAWACVIGCAVVVGLTMHVRPAFATTAAQPPISVPFPFDPVAQAEAERLREDGEAAYGRGEFERARERLGRAHILYTQTKDLVGQARTLRYLSFVSRDLNERQQARDFIDRAIATAQGLSRPDIMAVLYNDLGDLLAQSGLLSEAVAAYNRALAVFQAGTDRRAEAITLNKLGVAHSDLGDQTPALDFFGRALALTADAKDRAVILKNVGVSRSKLGRYPEALEAFHDAVALLRQINDVRSLGLMFNEIGNVQYAQGRYPDALDTQQQALALFRQSGDATNAGTTLVQIGTIHRSQGRFAEAGDAYREALTILHTAADPWGEGQASNGLSQLELAQGHYAAAQQLAEQAVDLTQRASDRSAQASALSTLANIHQVQGRNARALEVYERSRALSAAIGDQRAVGAALNDIAEVYRAQGSYERARALYEQALTVATQWGNRPGQATTLHNLGSLHRAQGRHAEAREHYGRALAIAQELGDRQRVAIILNSLGVSLASQGRYAEALAAHTQAEQIFRDLDDRVGISAALNNAAEVYRGRGQYAEAFARFQEALALLTEPAHRAVMGTTLNNLGVLYHSQGRFADALRSYQQALEIHRAVENRSAEATTLNNLGQFYVDVGGDERALEYFQQTMAIQQTIGDLQGYGTTLSNIGGLYANQKDTERALQAYEESLAIRRQVGDRVGEGATLNEIGRARVTRQEYDLALAAYRQALAIHQELDSQSGQSAALNGQGVVELAQGQFLWASFHFEDALKITRAIGNRTAEGEILGNLGAARESLGNWEEALRLYEEAIDVKEAIRAAASLEDLKIGLGEMAVNAYQRAILLLVRRGDLSRAFELSERARARTFLDQLGNTRPNALVGAAPALIERERELREQLTAVDRDLRRERSRPGAEQDKQAIQTLENDLGNVQRLYEEILNKIKLDSPEYAALVSVAPRTLSEIQASLDRDMTVVSYLVTSGRTLAFLVTRDSLNMVTLSVTEDELGGMTREFRASARTREKSDDSARQLHEALIAPFRDQIRTPMLGIVPNGVLHYLPFAALTDGRTYVGDRYTLFYLPSASALHFVEQKRKSSEPSLLAIAQNQAQGFPLLRHANREAEEIARLYQTQALTDGAATEVAFVAGAAQHSILHLAAHGQINTSRPIFSRILLGPSSDADGSLTAYEVYALNLARSDLVVLSACQTNVGERSRGDDFVALSRAFMYAGAPTVVASLWQVDDEATATFMTSFYAHHRQGQSKAEALRAAQAETRTKYPDPHHWAAFVLTGDPGPTASGWPSPLTSLAPELVPWWCAGLRWPFRWRRRWAGFWRRERPGLRIVR